MASKITKDAVWELASRLYRQGTKPTQNVVQSYLGGSMRDIVPHLRSWREENIPKRPTIVIDSALTKALQAMADRHIEAMEKACDERVKEVEKELDATIKEANDLEKRVTEALKEGKEVSEQIESYALGEAKQSRIRAEAAEARADELAKIDEQRSGEIRRLEEAIAKLENQLAAAQAEVVSQTSRAAAAEATVKTLQAQIDTLLAMPAHKQ